VLDSNSGTDGHVLMMRSNLRTQTLGTRLGNARAGTSVELVDTVTMRGKVVEQIDPTAGEYITDGNGVIRIVGRAERNNETGYLTGRTHYSYRKPGEKRWTAMSTVDMDGNGFDPYAVDPATNMAYGRRRHQGRMAAFRMALDGSGREELVFAHPEVDVGGFARIGRRGRVVGVRYTTDVSRVHYIDAELGKLAAALSKALPEAPLVRFVDSSEDENIVLMWAGSDTDAGRYYLFDRKGRKLEPLMADRPALDDIKLAAMKPITYRAADGTMVPGYLTLPVDRPARGLPAIVLPHGGPGARDVWGFDWLAHYFAAQGFAVLQPNFRGSAGYGDAWFQKNGFQSWQTAIGDVNDAGRYLIAEGIADPAKLGVFGWSYGGYAALQSVALDADLFKAVVAVAPVTDLSTLSEEWRYFSNFRIQ
jgi:dipeptidyl aminopeptidase/acylaminoacyl peptidase